MWFSSPLSRLPITTILFAQYIHAQSIIEHLSFGQKHPLSSDGRTLPGWNLSGENFTPQILSDRIILTSIAPHAKRGAVWTTAPLTSAQWTADFEFRANGPERGSGNLQIWLTQKSQGTASLYTTGAFDGLVVALDQYGGRGGSIRAFLNDGSTDYKTHHNVDRLPFGKCDYAYRNRGVPTKVQLAQGSDYFEIKVDDKSCFRSDKTVLPQGYYFGITAASADTADSFELNKFMVFGSAASSSGGSAGQQQQQDQKQNEQQRVQPGSSSNLPPIDPNANLQQSFGRTGGGSGAGSPLDDRSAQILQKLTPATDKIDNMYKAIFEIDKRLEERHNQLLSRMGSSGGGAGQPDQVRALEQRLHSIEQTLQRIQKDVESRDYQGSLQNIQNTLHNQHAGLLDSLPNTMNQIVTGASPKLGFFVFVILGFQVLLVGAYIVYKRRRNSMPKKFL